MSVRDRLSGIWLMATTLLALFAYTIYFVAQMWLNVLHALFLTLVVLQIAALILYLWGPEKLKSWPIPPRPRSGISSWPIPFPLSFPRRSP